MFNDSPHSVSSSSSSHGSPTSMMSSSSSHGSPISMVSSSSSDWGSLSDIVVVVDVQEDEMSAAEMVEARAYHGVQFVGAWMEGGLRQRANWARHHGGYVHVRRWGVQSCILFALAQGRRGGVPYNTVTALQERPFFERAHRSGQPVEGHFSGQGGTTACHSTWRR